MIQQKKIHQWAKISPQGTETDSALYHQLQAAAF